MGKKDRPKAVLEPCTH